MATKDRRDYLLRCIYPFTSLMGILSLLIASPHQVVAQITPDNTLGTENSIVTPNVNIRGLPADLIEGGATRGAALFQSFQEFNVGNGQRVYFANPTGIENIFSRVTGTDISDILGTLGVNGGANLFFLNPNGIIFGENAALDVRGSFVASTADCLVFGNLFNFSATNPEAPPLLTVNVTPGLQYGANSQGTISNAGNLSVGQNLTLSAHRLNLQGKVEAGGDLTLRGLDTVQMRDSIANPFIAAAGGKLVVQGDETVDIFALNHPDSGLFSMGDMILRSRNTVGGDAHYWSGGNFRIEKLDGSLGNLFSPYDPIIRSLGNVSFDTYFGASLHILAGGLVDIGTVIISQPETGTVGSDFINETIQLSDGGEIQINGSQQPILDIRAGVDPAQIGSPGITGINFSDFFFPSTPVPTNITTSANLNIGYISLALPDSIVFLTNQYKPNTSLTGGDITITEFGGIDALGIGGDGSAVIFDSRGNIKLDSFTSINTSSLSGNAGNITLLANNSISLTNGAEIESVTFGSGNAGNINIKSESLSLDNDAYLNTSTLGLGNGGNLNINTRSLSVTNGAYLTADTYGQGDAGSINIQATDTIFFSGADINGSPTSITSSVAPGAVGNEGNLNISTRSLLVNNGAYLSTGTFGQGDAGSVNIQATDTISVSSTDSNGFPSSITSYVALGAEGKGGNINITTRALSLSDSGYLSAGTFRQGNAGNIQVTATDFVDISGSNSSNGLSSGLFTSSERGANGAAGNIAVNTGAFRLADGALVNTLSYTGDAGDVTINANTFEALGGGQILTLSRGAGDAGNLTINATDSITISGSDPTFASRFGQFGSNVVNNQGAASALITDADLGSTGNGGNLFLNTRSLTVTDGAIVSASTYGTGDGGDLRVMNFNQAAQLVEVSGNSTLFALVGKGNTGNGGNLTIDTQRLVVRERSQISTSTFGSGKGGDLTFRASDSVEVSGNSYISTGVTENATGDGGNLTIETGRLVLENGSAVSTSTFGAGNAGDLTVNASDAVEVSSNSLLFARTLETATGDGGNLTIDTGRLIVQNSRISASTLGAGDAGDLKVTASDSVDLSNQSVLSAIVNENATGNGGNLTIDTGQLVMRNSLLSTSTLGTGNAGDLTVITSDSVEARDNSIISANVGENATGDGGNLIIDTGQLLVQDRSGISTATLGGGEAGNLKITASDSVTVNRNSFLSAQTNGTEDGGNLLIDTGRLLVQNGSGVSVTTAGAGNAGNLTIRAADSVDVSGRSIVSAGVNETATGNGGDVTINTRQLVLHDRGSLSVGTFGGGEGGKLNVNASDSVAVIRDSSIEAGTTGSQPAGDVTITTRQLLVEDRSQISTATSGAGNGGGLRIAASDSVAVGARSRISSSALEGTGNGGDLRIETGQFTVRDGGQVLAGTFDKGNAGTLTIFASDSVKLIGASADDVPSGLFTQSQGSGGAGGLKITTGDLIVRDGATVSVSGLGSGNPGDLEVDAGSIFLNQGSLEAATISGTGANIRLQVADNIIMRNRGLISAKAENNGSGGNINIIADFVIGIPTENSDIIANAFEGPGGQINITTQRIFGLEFRDEITPLSDISASSKFGVDGVVAITQPDIDPSRGLIQLPLNLVDPTRMIDRQCTANRKSQSSFIVTGRGGIPRSPTDPFEGDAVITDLALSPTLGTVNSANPPQPNQIIEAQGLVKTPDGKIFLVAQTPTVTPQSDGNNPAECNTF
ncbi:MAG TPA: hypothetical protein DDW51_18390 [Cyanobacteria bacterium UBA11367]|nr:hypothetical protein [Cyanobacteria bacterium UBA11367]